MNNAGEILSISPKYAIPGGEVLINCKGLKIDSANNFGCYFNGEKARIVGASSERVLAIVPDNIDVSEADVHFEVGSEKSSAHQIIVGKQLADNLHLVGNPAVDPNDNSIILTRSGSRGQELPVTLFRLNEDGFLVELSAKVINPTGLAFDSLGRLFVTNRADGEVYQINKDNEAIPIASDLGVATGIAFDKNGDMFIGDRSETIFKVSDLGEKEVWAMLEASVSAFHLAFGLDGNLYVSAPGLCSYDSVHKVDEEGLDTTYFKGLGRPQGLAFDEDGNLYVAACFEGRHGIVKLSENGTKAELFVAGTSIVGLCFTRKGEMIVATSDKVFSLPMDIYGILLD